VDEITEHQNIVHTEKVHSKEQDQKRKEKQKDGGVDQW